MAQPLLHFHDRSRRARYTPPETYVAMLIKHLIEDGRRNIVDESQLEILRGKGNGAFVYLAGNPEILTRRSVSIVGTREASTEGLQRASKLARELVENSVVVMSGLARGIDTAALTSAISNKGSVVGVIGTPLDKAYPIENADLQEEIYKDHVLISPFGEGETVFKSNFPKRNRVMALLSDATVIVEASDTSGTLHQAAECLRQQRWLFIMSSVLENRKLSWPKEFIGKERVGILKTTADLLDKIT
jgi:DNA protecting protein DprA